ncbi:hypothetical protein B0H65DRAFT_429508, partial [Neurospora tetraspora]
TFHLFPRLPIELRLMIWEATISPRIIDVRASTYNDDDDGVTPAPPILHTCRESRNVGLHIQGGYQFSNLSLPYFDGSLYGRPRYIWVNFELDMIDIGGPSTWLFNEYRPNIKRLRIELHHHRAERAGYVWRKRDVRLLETKIREKFGQLREICVCIPCEYAHLGLPPDWLPGGSDGAFMEGWRSMDWGRSCRDGDEDTDGERGEDGKTDGDMWVLVLKKINAIGNLREPE